MNRWTILQEWGEGMTMRKMPYILESALARIAGELRRNWLGQPPVWLLGGSSGLFLHGVTLSASPRDIDLYADLEDAMLLHEALSCVASSESVPEDDYSGGCYSLRSRYLIGDAKVELVCGFRIGCGKWEYSVDVKRLLQHAPIQEFTGVGLIRLMPVAHELVFNMLRRKMERCIAIAALIKGDLSHHLPLLQHLVLENGLDQEFQGQMDELLGTSSSLKI